MKNSLLKLRERLDMGSMAVIVITFTLFVVSLFQKGLTHEILVDTGIFLVSVKLIVMSFKNNLYMKDLNQQLEEIRKLIKKS